MEMNTGVMTALMSLEYIAGTLQKINALLFAFEIIIYTFIY